MSWILREKAHHASRENRNILDIGKVFAMPKGKSYHTSFPELEKWMRIGEEMKLSKLGMERGWVAYYAIWKSFNFILKVMGRHLRNF